MDVHLYGSSIFDLAASSILPFVVVILIKICLEILFESFFSFIFLVGVLNLTVFLLSIQGPHLAVLINQVECWGLNSAWPLAR